MLDYVRKSYIMIYFLKIATKKIEIHGEAKAFQQRYNLSLCNTGKEVLWSQGKDR